MDNDDRKVLTQAFYILGRMGGNATIPLGASPESSMTHNAIRNAWLALRDVVGPTYEQACMEDYQPY